MSVVLERLRVLSRQSGSAPRAPDSALRRPAGAPGACGHSSHPCESQFGLRELLRSRHNGELPGKEIAAGLRVVEERVELALDVPTTHLFIDTETTGLAGGSGTIAFLVGIARVRGGALELTQWLLTRISAEGPMLDALTNALQPDDELVTYNGKCFDRPLLSTRFRLQRRADPLRDRVHHDLLHAVRRRYKREWENCRLLTAERELLGVVREDDLPGSEAPAAWRAYLRTGATHALRRVATHNRQDLVSLARIAERIDSTSAGTPGQEAIMLLSEPSACR
jgi:uncharacterized protein YprB with RNaseH-like and TPR domain